MRIKMYKSGKQWLTAGIVLASAFAFANTVAFAAGNNTTTGNASSSITANSNLNSQNGTTKVEGNETSSNLTADNTQSNTNNSENNSNTGSTTDKGSVGTNSTNQPATNTTSNTAAQASQDSTQSPRDAALAKYASQHTTGYVYSPEVSTANGGWNWLEDGKPFTGFRYYMGTYYWFVDGVRQNAGWRNAWGLTYYTDDNGRAVQGQYNINGQDFNFGNDGTYYLRSTGYLYDGSNQNGGFRWYENGQLYSGFRYYTGTYYWFVDGVRQNAGWRNAWGLTYYTDDNGRAVQGLQTIDNNQYDFGNDGTYYVRKNQTEWIDGQQYRSDNDGKVTPWSGFIASGNDGWRWYENGQLFTGFRYYMGTYYWFENGVRSDNAWHDAWGMKYYTGGDGRAVQGLQTINNNQYDFGNDGSYYLRTNQTDWIDGQQYHAGNDGVLTPWSGYIYYAPAGGWRWFENGQSFTGFRYYMGTYYWFENGVRSDNAWHDAWGMKYYTGSDGRAVQGVQGIDGGTYFFGFDGSYFMRTNQYYTDGSSIYFAGGDGRALTGNQSIYGRNVTFDGNGRLDVSQLNIDFYHWSLNQNQLGAPEGCEGVSFQMALSAKGKNVPDIHDIYNRIGYGFNVSADQGFHGNPFGGSQWYTQTVLASALARNLNGAFGVQTKDITGAGVNDVLIQLLSWNPVITYIPWNLQINNASNNFHVQLIYGYQNGGFKIADPLQLTRGANYWLSTGDWQYLNSNVQPTGYGAPASMNVAVI